MYKRFAYLALLISLVGQFLLSPAMAMPKFLHASSHAQQEVKQQITKQPMAAMRFGAKEHHRQDSANCDNSLATLNTAMVDCDTLCEILGAGGCVAHCLYTPAIIEQSQLNLTPPAVGQSLQTVFWAPQTAEQSLINPPPISLHV